MHVSEVQPAASAEAGQWLLRHDVHWQDLARLGPPDFSVHLRIRFEHNPPRAEQKGELLNLRRALTTLARYTTTPSAAYAAVWEGWTAGDPAPDAPRLHIPNRTMLLFSGAVEVLRDAPARAWQRDGGEYAEPHFVWPEDRAWCLACDVDEEVEFTVGCADDAAEALIEELPGATRRVQYGDPAPSQLGPI